MHIGKYNKSRFTQKADVDPPVTGTIEEVEEIDMAGNGEPPDLLPLVHFEEAIKPFLVSSRINRESIARIVGSPDTNDWPGHRIVLYLDPNVEYRGKIEGGIRIRAPKPKPSQASNDEPPIEWGDEGDDEPQEKPVAKQKPKPSAPRPVRRNKRLTQQRADEPASDELADSLAETKRSRPL